MKRFLTIVNKKRQVLVVLAALRSPTVSIHCNDGSERDQKPPPWIVAHQEKQTTTYEQCRGRI